MKGTMKNTSPSDAVATAEAAVDRAAAKSRKLDRVAREATRLAAESEAFAARVFPGGYEAAKARAVEAVTKRDAAVIAATEAEAAYDRAEARLVAAKKAR